MVMDVDVIGSPGWWMARLWGKLSAELPRLDRLAKYDEGRPPLPWASETTSTKFYRFQETSRTNFAELLVDAPAERIGLRSVSTEADTDVSGDAEAWKMIMSNDADIEFATATRNAFKFGRGYLVTSAPDEDEEYSKINSADPRQFITEPDPLRRSRQRAAFSITHDDTFNLDVATLWLPGKKYVAVYERGRAAPRMMRVLPDGTKLPDLRRVAFNPTKFTLRPESAPGDTEGPDGIADPYRSESYDSSTVPVQVLENKDGVGVFEQHTDILDRINHQTFMLMVNITMQAFRQRALRQSANDSVEPLPATDESGQVIDYNALFEAGPDAMWLLPPGAEMWESQQVDVSGALAAIKADLLKLSAVTRTPMSMLTPDAIAQSAEGAQMAREGIVYRVNQFLRGAGRAMSRAVAIGFEFMDDETRSDPATVTVNFLPAEQYSLAEKGSAAAQAINSLPRETIADVIWQLDPIQIDAANAQWMKQQMQNQIAAQAATAAQPASARPSKQSEQDPNDPRAAEGQGVATDDATDNNYGPEQQ